MGAEGLNEGISEEAKFSSVVLIQLFRVQALFQVVLRNSICETSSWKLPHRLPHLLFRCDFQMADHSTLDQNQRGPYPGFLFCVFCIALIITAFVRRRMTDDERSS